MEEYLRNMRSLRSQMNEIEEAEAKRSVEEQKQRTAIDSLHKDLDIVRSETKCLSNEAEEMVKARGEAYCQIAEKQKKVAALEIESSTLSQTLELLQQELASTSVKLKEKRTYWTKVSEDLRIQLQDQQEWLSSYMRRVSMDSPSVEEIPAMQAGCVREKPGDVMHYLGAKLQGDEASESYKDLITQLESANVKLEEVLARKSEISLASTQSKEILEQVKNRFESVPAELKAMDMETLEEEHKALLADKAGEIEYFQSLQDQIKQLKSISHLVKCQCGEEYKVELMA